MTYYTINPTRTLRALKDFVEKDTTVAIFESADSNRPDPKSPLESHDDAELRFRNFLSENTQICLEVIESYGEHGLQELVTHYRYILLAQRIAPENLFASVFESHSESYRKLKASSLDNEYWHDLVHVHPGNNYGLHFMVNMLAVSETAYHPWFLQENWVPR